MFKYFQPATLLAIFLFWTFLPAKLAENTWIVFGVTIFLKAMILGLEQVNERYASWRLTRKELLTDLFYVGLGYIVIKNVHKWFVKPSLEAAEKALGIDMTWLPHAPFAVQVMVVIVIGAFSGYWLHRAMHNWHPLWLTHAPHHYITQLNALKGAVGNPLELFLLGLSLSALFDLPMAAGFCAGNMMGAVSTFAHANIRFDPPRWYSFFFTTVEAHSLHHSTDYESTRSNYADSFILMDRIFGTHRDGESEEVGQDGRRRLSIREQMLFPFVPLIDMMKARQGQTANS